jgi:predicted MFS family arabinose efflux permease
MSNNKNRKPHFLDDYDDGEYLGNIWGWKFSFISLAVIIVLSTYVIYSFATQEVPVEPTHQEPIQKND